MENKKVFFETRSLFYGFGISYMLNLTSNGILLAEILGIVLGILFLNSCKNVPISFPKKIISLILILFLSITIVNMGHSLYLSNTPIFLLALFTNLSLLFLNNFKNIEKVNEIIFYNSIVLLVIKTLFLLPLVNLENFLPINSFNWINIIKAGIIFCLISVFPIFTIESKIDKNVVKSYLFSTFTILIASFLIVSVLGLKESIFYRFPEYIVLKRIKILNFINNVDNIFTFVIVSDIYTTIINAKKSLKIKNKFIDIILLIFITFITSYFITNMWLLTLLYKYFPIIILLLLLILLLSSKIFRYKKGLKRLS